MPQEESVLLNINERYGESEPVDNHMKRRNARMMGAALVLSVVAVVAIVTLTSQAGQRTELAEDVAKRLGYSLARKPRQFTMLDGEPVVAPVPAISAVAGAHAAECLAVALPDARMPSNAERFVALASRWTLREGIGAFDVNDLSRVPPARAS